MTETQHQLGQRVRCTFDNREGRVVELSGDGDSILIEFKDKDGRTRFTHRKWLPARHWKIAA